MQGSLLYIWTFICIAPLVSCVRLLLNTQAGKLQSRVMWELTSQVTNCSSWSDIGSGFANRYRLSKVAIQYTYTISEIRPANVFLLQNATQPGGCLRSVNKNPSNVATFKVVMPRCSERQEQFCSESSSARWLWVICKNKRSQMWICWERQMQVWPALLWPEGRQLSQPGGCREMWELT